MKGTRNIIIIIMAVAMAACAPKPEEKSAPEIETSFGPQHQDVTLDLSNLNEKTKASKDSWPRRTNMTALQKLEFAENVHALSNLYNIPALKEAVLKDLRGFRQTHQTSTQDFDGTPYVEAIVGVTAKEARDQVAEAEKFLPADEQKILDLLSRSETSYPWPASDLTSDQAVQFIQSYLTWFMQQLNSLGLNELVLKTLSTEIPKQANETLDKLKIELAKIMASQTSLESLQHVQELAVAMNYEVAPETKELISKGLRLADNVLKISDEQDVLSVVVEIFKMLSPEERISILAKESQDLYDFLADASENRLACLQERGCKRDPIVYLGKKLKIFPQIKERGVANLREKIDLYMRGYVFNQVAAELTKATRSIPSMIAEEIKKGVQGKMAELAQIKNDYPGYVKKIAKKWSDLRLSGIGGKIRGLEQLQIGASSTGGQSGSELVGQGLVMKTRILNEDSDRLSKEERIEWSLEILNKLLAVGGYKKTETETFQPLLQALDMDQQGKNPLLQEILKSPLSFAVPDRFEMKSAYGSKPSSWQSINVSVLGQARLLRGFAESINYLKDWRATSFDEILGHETVSQAMAHVPAAVGDRKLFPKDALVALAIGDGAVILKNLLKDFSTVFIIAQESKIIWANLFNLSDADNASMAGVVNLSARVRGKSVLANDVSEYIIALNDFARALEGVENTKSTYLKNPDANGNAAITELIEAQRQMKMLVVGLANFLSSKMISKDGFVHETYSYANNRLDEGPISTMTQFHAIQGLLRAYEVTHVQPYLWSAIDLYYKINQSLYDKNSAFYRGVDTLEEGAEVLAILKELSKHLPSNSQSQLDRLTHSWASLIQARL